MGQNDVDAPTADGDDQVYGIAASAGKYSGTVRNVPDETEFCPEIKMIGARCER